jgi:AcrR family transcriptional regulator
VADKVTFAPSHNNCQKISHILERANNKNPALKAVTPAASRAAAESPRKPARASSATRAIGRPPGKRRIGKELLVTKTAKLLRTMPPEKLSLSAAARHARVHLTLFKYYFQDRTRLLVDVAHSLSKEIGDRVAEIENDGQTAPERLAVRVDAMIEFFTLNPFYHRLMVEIIRDDSGPASRKMIDTWMSRTVDIYQSIIDAGVAEGTLRPVDPQFTFFAIMGLCEQCEHASKLFVHSPGAHAETPVSAIARYRAFVLDLVLDGVGANNVVKPAGGPRRPRIAPAN